jgi:hypothetical protein
VAAGLDLLQNASDWSAGFGDAVTFGGIREIRRLIDYLAYGEEDDVVDNCSDFYTWGGFGGQIANIGMLAVGTVQAGGALVQRMAQATQMASGGTLRTVAGGAAAATGGGTGAANTAATVGRELTTYYPPNRGFLRSSSGETLEAGTRIDRYAGTFVSPAGTPLEMRALPPGAGARDYHVYEVVEPFTVEAGTVAPWHGQLGLGTQYELPRSVAELVEQGFLKGVS